VAGYDVGGAVSQMLAARRPDLVKALVVSPHLPGAGKRALELGAAREFWYTSFHQLDLARQLIDGNRDAVRAYLRHFWPHWSGPSYVVDDERIIWWMCTQRRAHSSLRSIGIALHRAILSQPLRQRPNRRLQNASRHPRRFSGRIRIRSFRLSGRTSSMPCSKTILWRD
jgi:pimeloyl-ACP methyl ester carboxylesterase